MSPEEGAIMGKEAFIRALMNAESVYVNEAAEAEKNGLDNIRAYFTERAERVRRDRQAVEASLTGAVGP